MLPNVSVKLSITNSSIQRSLVQYYHGCAADVEFNFRS